MHNSLIQLEQEFQLRPVLAAELEFYVQDALSESHILKTLDEICPKCLPAEKERGADQYEIATEIFKDTEEFVTHLNQLRKLIAAHFEADFSAKPFPQDYGSALHFHLHLEDASGVNVFTRSEDGTYSEALLQVMGGLLATMQKNLAVFSPNDTCRFEAHGKHSPTHLSWGPNNRSVALRLPDKPLHHKHIEHRVSSADADIATCVEALLAGALKGLREKIDPGEPTYGNAWDAQYGLERLLSK